MLRHCTQLIFCVSLFALNAVVMAQAPPQYRATFITPGLSAINASAMNNAGSVVGTGTTGSGAWVSHNGEPATLLPVPPGFDYAIANDISDSGVIVGSVNWGYYPWMGYAAAWIPNASGGYDIVQFGTLPGHVSSSATAVNNVGDVVGTSSNGMFRFPVWFTAPGGIQDLSSTGIFDPVSINVHRVLVDQSFTAKKLDLNTMQVQDLGTADDPPGGQTGYLASRAEGINDAGQVAGQVILATSTNCDRQAARFTDDVGWEVLSMCGSANGAYDINNQGDVVMRLNVAPYVRFEGISTFLIENLIVNDVGHWYVINGFGITINDSRQMAVPATNSVTNEGGMILLTPIAVAGDITADGQVNVQDLLAVLNAWGVCPSPGQPCHADIAPAPSGDGQVNVLDLLMVIANWN